MKSVLAAEPAVLLKLKSVRVVLLVLLCVIVSLLALAANQSDLDSCIISHFSGTSHFNLLNLPLGRPVYLPPSAAVVLVRFKRFTGTTKKTCKQR